MKEYLSGILMDRGTISFEEIVLHILAAAIISIGIYASYWYTHTGTAYSKKFNVSLVTLTILTATVMTVIGNNIALSLGMVGALSIVRFRTAIKDSRDTTYIFWAIIVGICCGVGDYIVATVGTIVVFIVLFLFGRVRNENRYLLIIRAKKDRMRDIEGLVFVHFDGKAVLRAKNTTQNDCEFIFEVTKKNYEESYKKELDIIAGLYALGDIEYANIVAQSDEITG